MSMSQAWTHLDVISVWVPAELPDVDKGILCTRQQLRGEQRDRGDTTEVAVPWGRMGHWAGISGWKGR